MKTLLHILTILIIATLVGAGIYAVVENTSLVSNSEIASGGAPTMPSTEEQVDMIMEPPEGGDHHAASLTRGLSEVLGTVAKLTGITLLVLIVQKGLALLRKFTFRLSRA